MKDMPDTSNRGQNIFWTRWGVISILIGIFITGLVIGLLLRSGGGPAETTGSTDTVTSDILFWTCSMHPQMDLQYASAYQAERVWTLSNM